mmetsp:Transcript_107243/g.298726  ORF Transcript_107243/g.298726 Transcript_107243/m.298726 type:complete len:239 (+) Transcript_107243:1758-2474(+)
MLSCDGGATLGPKPGGQVPAPGWPRQLSSHQLSPRRRSSACLPVVDACAARAAALRSASSHAATAAAAVLGTPAKAATAAIVAESRCAGMAPGAQPIWVSLRTRTSSPCAQAPAPVSAVPSPSPSAMPMASVAAAVTAASLPPSSPPALAAPTGTPAAKKSTSSSGSAEATRTGGAPCPCTPPKRKTEPVRSWAPPGTSSTRTHSSTPARGRRQRCPSRMYTSVAKAGAPSPSRKAQE